MARRPAATIPALAVALVRATGLVGLAAFAWAVLMGILTGNPQLTKIQLEADPGLGLMLPVVGILFAGWPHKVLRG